MVGINKYEGKDRRRQRLRNHVARDLRDPKFRQRVVPDKRKYRLTEEYDDDE